MFALIDGAIIQTMKRNQLLRATERMHHWHLESQIVKFVISIPLVSYTGNVTTWRH